jgi:CRISPR type I-A-associated protein Csa5
MDMVEDIANMLRPFVRCRMYSIIDRLANATSKEAVEMALYEALRISRSAAESYLCKEDEREVRSHIAREENIDRLLSELDEDLMRGLEIVRRIAIKSLSWPERREGGEG